MRSIWKHFEGFFIVLTCAKRALSSCLCRNSVFGLMHDLRSILIVCIPQYTITMTVMTIIVMQQKSPMQYRQCITVESSICSWKDKAGHDSCNDHSYSWKKKTYFSGLKQLNLPLFIHRIMSKEAMFESAQHKIRSRLFYFIHRRQHWCRHARTRHNICTLALWWLARSHLPPFIFIVVRWRILVVKRSCVITQKVYPSWTR